MRGNLPGPEGLARRGASAALHGLSIVSTMDRAARLASAPSPCQRGSREILRQAPLGLGESTMPGLPLRIIVGLGNPGPEHQVTRHNVGFWFVDLLARRHGGEFRDYRKDSRETARGTIDGQELIFLKPTTYIKRSGFAVRQTHSFYKIPPGETLGARD